MTIEWRRAVSPTPPPAGPGRLHVVADAALTVVERGPLRTDGWPSLWMRGAVYDGHGVLVEDSQRLSISAAPVAAADPVDYPGRPVERLRRLEGRWLYGGHWVQHFGHFLVDTLPTLWPDRDAVTAGAAGGGVRGIVCHKYLMQRWSVDPWMQRLLDLAGWGGLPVEMVGQRGPLAVDELLVPSRAVAVRGWVTPEAITVWDRLAAGREPSARRSPGGSVYLTRTGVNAAARAAGQDTRTTAGRDAELDAVFAAAGFEVVAPETLAIDDQLELVATAGVLAGLTGSALHLAALAPSSTRVIEVGDARTRDAAHPTQAAIDAARGREVAFVPYDVTGPDLAAAVATLVDGLG